MLRIAFPRTGIAKELILLLQEMVRLSPQSYAGSGDPNGVQTGNIGDLYTNTDGGAGNTLWVKESGNNTSTGWVAK